MKPIKVVWAMVSYGAMPFPAVYASHIRVVAYASRHFTVVGPEGSKIAGVGATDRTYTHQAENQVALDFLAIEDATHIMMVEQDMILPDDALVKLAALDKPIASGLYFLRNGRGQPCLYIKTFTPADNPYPHAPVTAFPTDRPFQMDPRGGGCVGLGCVLIKREVFEKVPEPWFDLKAKGYGSDMFFATKVRQAGIPVWVDPTVRCDQIDYVVVGFDDYLKRIQEDPGFQASGAIVAAPEVLV